MQFSIYRYNPDTDKKPYNQDFVIPDSEITPGMMLLEALLKIKNEQDESLSFRRSCQEGVCGSDGMNINGKNGLACITPLSTLAQPIRIRPFPGMPVIRDLVVDMNGFYNQYKAARPYLVRKDPLPEKEIPQSPEDRDKLDGLYECILCGCCSSACPSYWWNPDKFLGPAALLQASRFIQDSRDQATEERLELLNDVYKLYRCHTIMNCADVCPMELNPSRAINEIRGRMLKNSI